MSFDEIFDLTAGVYFNFYNIVIQGHSEHVSAVSSGRYSSLQAA